MRPVPVSVVSVFLVGTFGCSQSDNPTGPSRAGAVADITLSADRSVVDAQGTYHFVVPPDFNGGIFGIAIDNDVSFVARRGADGSVTGRFRYVQSPEGEKFIFSGRVTCLEVYDTPVLTYFEDIPPMTHNRAKWGGLIEKSNDPTLPAGTYIWFQSIDNNSAPASAYPDASTLSGFGDEAANEAFCGAATVPNSNYGPHAVASGNILVR
jgi:hypothetical protein